MTKLNIPGGSFTFADPSMTLNRMGYGAMQLAGPQVWGLPRDVDAAVAVLREAVASGVNHIDTSDYYGPHVTNQIIKRALYPYPKELGAPINDCPRCETPVGELCARCEEEFMAGDQGLVTCDGSPFHNECFMRSIVGSVGHQLRTCSCFVPGASENDPPELTKRQAAKLAVELWEKNERQRDETTSDD